jgi:hypothetical protein
MKDNWSDYLPERVECGIEELEPADWLAIAKSAGNQLLTLVIMLVATLALAIVFYLFMRGGL